MPHVFRGKIAIPGDQMEAYFEALGQFENAKAPMRKQLEECARDFERALAQHYAPKTVRKHMAIIALVIDFVCWDTEISCAGILTSAALRRSRAALPIVHSASGICGKWAIGPKANSRRRSRSFGSCVATVRSMVS